MVSGLCASSLYAVLIICWINSEYKRRPAAGTCTVIFSYNFRTSIFEKQSAMGVVGQKVHTCYTPVGVCMHTLVKKGVSQAPLRVCNKHKHPNRVLILSNCMVVVGVIYTLHS